MIVERADSVPIGDYTQVENGPANDEADTVEPSTSVPTKQWIGGPKWRSAHDPMRENRERQDVLAEIRERQGECDDKFDPLHRN